MLKYFFQAMEGKLLDGRYRLISLLGEGGIGFVALGEQVSVGRKVAIKFLRSSLQQTEQLDRFKLEAKALAALNHPCCLTLHDFGYAEELESYYMVTEYVEGVELTDAVNKGMPLGDILLLMSHVCDALAYAHERGILHRDLKPSNIMVTGSHATPVKLLDFGLARLLDQTFDGGARLSMTGHVYGTPAYMSPEQCRAVKDLTPASDVYSLGVLLYQLCTRRLPFSGSTMTQVLISHVRDEYEPLDNDDLPVELATIIHAMLSKEPEDRPDNLYEVRHVLERVAQNMDRSSAAIRSTPYPGLSSLPSMLLELEMSSDSISIDAPVGDIPTRSTPPAYGSEPEVSEALELIDEVIVADTPEPSVSSRPRDGAFDMVLAVVVVVVCALGAAVAVSTSMGEASLDSRQYPVAVVEPVMTHTPVRAIDTLPLPPVSAPRQVALKPRRVSPRVQGSTALTSTIPAQATHVSPRGAKAPTRDEGAKDATSSVVVPSSSKKRARTLSFD